MAKFWRNWVTTSSQFGWLILSRNKSSLPRGYTDTVSRLGNQLFPADFYCGYTLRCFASRDINTFRSADGTCDEAGLSMSALFPTFTVVSLHARGIFRWLRHSCRARYKYHHTIPIQVPYHERMHDQTVQLICPSMVRALLNVRGEISRLITGAAVKQSGSYGRPTL